MELTFIWVVLFHSTLVSSCRTFDRFAITRTNSNHTTIIILLENVLFIVTNSCSFHRLHYEEKSQQKPSEMF